MKFHQKCMTVLLVLAPLLVFALVARDAGAQQAYRIDAAAPRIDSFHVEKLQYLGPGEELNFAVQGTSGGTVTLHIAGAQRDLMMYETRAGVYEGSYTISGRDAIDAQSSVTANLRVGNKVASALLNESLHAGFAYQPTDQAYASTPRIEHFDVQTGAALSGGHELAFTLFGTPGGKAEVAIQGARDRVALHEVRGGEYTGIYTIKRRDRIEPNSTVSANLRVGQRVTTAGLGKTLVTGLPASGAGSGSSGQAAWQCASCGIIEAVNLVEAKGQGGYLGLIGGGVLGGLLGNQVGGGNGKKLATVAGAVAGAYAGREIERNANRTSHYEVLVRLQSGASQTVTFEHDPGYRIGEKVKIVDGSLTRDM